MHRPRVLSLFDQSGHWALPWLESGLFDVTLFDMARDPREDVRLIRPEDWSNVAVVLAAPPCTLLTKSAAKWRGRYTDAERTAALELARHTLGLIETWQPRVWAVENPPGLVSHFMRGRCLDKLVFQPWQYAGWLTVADSSLVVRQTELRDRYSKATAIWGSFAPPVQRPLPRLDRWGKQTAITWIPPGPMRACLRSRTPLGFARAFFAANIERAIAGH